MKNSELLAHPVSRAYVDLSLSLPPSAVMGISEDDPNMLRICAYCETKDAADAWARTRDYGVSHGICSACMANHFPDLVIPRVTESVASLSDATLAECAIVKERYLNSLYESAPRTGFNCAGDRIDPNENE